MARSNEIDPRVLNQLAGMRASRRRFLGRGAATAAAFALGPAFLAACSDDDSSTSTEGTVAQDSGSLRISNWPLYMVDGFVDRSSEELGFSVDYREDFNDNEEWFAKVQEPLSRQQDIGADLVVPTTFMATRLINLGWLNEINAANVPNKSNLRPDLLESPTDPGRQYTMPYMSGMVGLAYNRDLAGREITSIDDLWDPAFAGQVSLFSDFQDGLGMIMLSQGNTPVEPTTDAVQAASDKVAEESGKGQIRRFTGNDYIDDLAAGNLVIAQAYSGDVVQLQADNPALDFVVPESGATTFVDTMVIPYTSKNQAGAEAWINFVYDRTNYAELVNFVQYVPVLSDMTEALEMLDPEVAENPLVNPPPEIIEKLYGWAPLSDEQEQEYAGIYLQVTGG
jgi:spermidine/putrescine transport system substrate-binding protein